jgi:hypothetical protein
MGVPRLPSLVLPKNNLVAVLQLVPKIRLDLVPSQSDSNLPNWVTTQHGKNHCWVVIRIKDRSIDTCQLSTPGYTHLVTSSQKFKESI